MVFKKIAVRASAAAFVMLAIALAPNVPTALANFHILDFEFHADFHDLRARNLEICAGPLGIVVHECK